MYEVFAVYVIMFIGELENDSFALKMSFTHQLLLSLIHNMNQSSICINARY